MKENGHYYDKRYYNYRNNKKPVKGIIFNV
jgi:hypothetical protein